MHNLSYARWEELGLAAVPFGADNGVHASASPVEAAFERATWLPGRGEVKDSAARRPPPANTYRGIHRSEPLARRPV